MRFVALLMLVKASDIVDIAFAIGKTVITIGNWFQKYMTEGIDSPDSFGYKSGQPRPGINQINQIRIWVTYENPGSTKEVREYIKEHFGVTYCVETAGVLPGKHGLQVIRPKTIPGNSPSVGVQRQFVREYHETEASGEPGSIVLFGDVMHLIHQNVPGLCQEEQEHPPVLETNTGRRRPDILGAYNPRTHSFHHITGEKNCDAEHTIEFLEMIHNAYYRAEKSILIYFYKQGVPSRLFNLLI